MARPSQDAIDTFMGITGASEAVAVLKLEEHGGDLNEAVNAYFSEGDRTNVHSAPVLAPQNDFMNIDDPIDVENLGPPFPLLSAARAVNPFALLDSNFGRSLFDGEGASLFTGQAPRVSHPREVREIPIELKDGIQTGSSGPGPAIEDVTGSAPAHGPEIHGSITIDDEEDEDLPVTSAAHDAGQTNITDDTTADDVFGRRPGPSVPPLVSLTDYSNDIEEEMIQAAIEASKREADSYPNQQFSVPDGSSGSRHDQKSPMDVELAHAVSLSLKTAEQEKALREQGMQDGLMKMSSSSSGVKLEEAERLTGEDGRQGFGSSNIGTSSQSTLKEEHTSVQEEAEDVEEQPLVRHRSRPFASGSAESVEAGQVVNSPPLSPQQHTTSSHSQHNGDPFQSAEWGGISSEEHDEAVMLEAAIFGGIPEGTSYHYAYPPHQTGSDRNTVLYPRIPRSPSPTLTAQRLLREQQDDEYLAALQADREKELKAMQEAELRRLAEAAAKEAALEKEKHQEEETRRRLLVEEEFQRQLAAKEASLPQEPAVDDETSVTLLVRMPDGSRRGRRFLKSDKLQFLFDYIDVGRVVKPGTYRLVRPFPRRTFTDAERELSLNELGLTSKQEALFLELV